MPYCTNCGTNNPQGSIFCPTCGTKIFINTSTKHLTEYKEKMYKNTVMSLKNEGKNFGEQKVKEALNSVLNKKSTFSEPTQSVTEIFKPERKMEHSTSENLSNSGGFTIWTWVYVVINALLIYLGYRIDTILGALLFSIVILLLAFLRRKNSKPYNWLVKFVLLLQLAYLILVLPEGILYLGWNTLLLILLFITNVMLVFKGNKK